MPTNWTTKMGKFLKIYIKNDKFTVTQIDSNKTNNLNIPTTNKEIELVIEIFP